MKIDQDTLYKSQGFWWSIDTTIPSLGGDLSEENVDGPYCLHCYSDLFLLHNQLPLSSPTQMNIAQCGNCARGFQISGSLDAVKRRVVMQYAIQKRSEKPKVSLDEPPAHVKVRDEDDTYFLAAKISEKDGKRVGVVYFGEKKKDQRKKDYTQIFLDLDDEQMRFDKSNKPPQEILASLSVEFPHAVQETKFRKE